MEYYGYSGKILEIDLTERKLSTSELKIADINNFIGGMGINCKLAADLFKPNTDPLSAQNPIIIISIPLIGYGMY